MNSTAELKLRTLLAKIAEARGLNAVEGSILSTLFLNPNLMTQRDIARDVGRSQSTVSRSLQRMVRRGVVKWNRRSGSREMLFALASEHPQGLILSGIQGWLNTNAVLKRELESILRDLNSESSPKAEQTTRALIKAIDYASILLEPVIAKIENSELHQN
jgi:DNA-binding transcriptional regulator GbsR (MarR family)